MDFLVQMHQPKKKKKKKKESKLQITSLNLEVFGFYILKF